MTKYKLQIYKRKLKTNKKRQHNPKKIRKNKYPQSVARLSAVQEVRPKQNN